MAQENFVVYTPEIDAIIKEEKNPNNLAEGFRNAAKRIEEELGEKNITPEKVQARYYLKFNKRKASTSNGNGKKTTSKAAKSSSSSETVKNVEENTNVTDEMVDEKYMLVRDFVAGLPKDKKLKLVKELWAGI